MKRTLRFLLLFVPLLFAGQTVYGQSENDNWDDQFANGPNDAVWAIAVNGSDVYIGGDFTTIGGQNYSHIAKWDGTGWSTLGSGVDARVLAIAIDGSDVYACGAFNNAGGNSASKVAVWNGSSWSALGQGLSSFASDIVVKDGIVYVGGSFINAGGIVVNHIAKWNGATWSGLASGTNGNVDALAVSGDNILVGGSFTDASSVSVNYLARWDVNGNQWKAFLNGDPNGRVQDILVIGNDIYCAGDFTSVGTSPTAANHVAKFDASVATWSALGQGVNKLAFALAARDAEVYVGGDFSTAGGSSANNIAMWDLSNLSAMGSGANDSVMAVAVLVDSIYVGGEFTQTGGKAALHFGRWIAPDPAVPVELTTFTAQLRNKTVNLRWNTATELNNFGFEIERKIIGAVNLSAEEAEADWQKIAFVEGRGTTNESHEYSYSDDVAVLLRSARAIKYRLKQIDLNGSFEYHGPIELALAVVPEQLELHQNYPNPFNPTTTIEFVIPVSGPTDLRIFNTRGQEVMRLVEKELEAGVPYKATFDAQSLPTGIYFYTLHTVGFTETKKMLLVR